MTDRTDFLTDPSIGASPWAPLGDVAPASEGRARSWRAPFWEEPQRRPMRLAEAIEREVVPLLVRAHRGADVRAGGREWPGKQPDTAEVIAFAQLILDNGAEVAFQRVDQMLLRGISVETVFLDVLAPAARHLGELWEADTVDFVAVTLGLGRLQQILRDLSPVLQAGARVSRQERHILLAAVPGEQHTFGLVMVAEFFLQAGWNVQGGPMTSAAEMALMVGRDWFDLVGLSMATEARVGQLTENIRAIRAASRNHAIGVMVGGPAFLAHPDLVDQVGADAMAANGDEATGHAEALLTRLRGDGVHQGPVPA